MLDFSRGFVIEEPSVVIPWGATEQELVEIVGAEALNHVTRGYYTVQCVALGGLRIHLGFHFQPRSGGKLWEFEVFRGDMTPLETSFAEFQAHLEAVLGPPSSTSDADGEFSHYEWRTPDLHVYHYVLDRFGPEEHVRFKRHK